ncbi:MAG: hypothetical protein ACRDZ3_12370 [Acidimicrobiia bacterium]
MSFLLVIVATIFLLSGLFLTKDLPLIFVSIGCSALAGLMLVIAVLRSRPRPGLETEPVGPAIDTVSPDYEMIPDAAPEVSVAPAAAETRPAETRPAEPRPAEPRPAEAGRFAGRAFPIPNYDRLEVVEVLPLLGDLEPAELEMVRQREASGRAHPWVLARVDALLEAEAGEWGPTADEMVDEVEDEPEVVAEDEISPAWGDPQPEWAGESDWSASDFPLDGGYDDGGYDDIEVIRDFPIDRYDELRANDILPLLSGLDAEDLKMVREEEAATKARTSVLSRIDVLLARETGAPAPAAKTASRSKGPSKAALALPIADYDNLTVGQITAQVPNLSVEELKAVRTYEKRHKARAGVLSRIESAMNRAG